MEKIKIKIKRVKKKLPLTFTSLSNCKAQLKCLLSLMPKDCKRQAKDKYRWNIFCGMVWGINKPNNILGGTVISSMFPIITFHSFEKKPPFIMPSLRKVN